jgi:type II secretory pathway component PulM
MNFMIRPRKQNTAPVAELETGRPTGTGEEWLGRNRSSKRRLWERLNPRSRGQIRIIAAALALQQTHAQLPEPLRARLSAAMNELERLVAQTRALLEEVARRTPPRV